MAKRPSGLYVPHWALLLCVLGGLFAMHGLGNHGTMRHESGNAGGTGAETAHARVTPSALSAVEVQPASDIGAVAITAWASEELQSHNLKGAADSQSTGMAGLCLAVLGGLLLLWNLRGRRREWLLPPPVARVTITRPRAARRDRDPPSLIYLSIHRC